MSPVSVNRMAIVLGGFHKFRRALLAVLATPIIIATACSEPAAEVSRAITESASPPAEANPPEPLRVGAAERDAGSGSLADNDYASPFELLSPSGVRRLDIQRYRSDAAVDAILPVYDPVFATSAEIDLHEDDLVIGVDIGSDARAYPVRMLRRREMVNDIVGGVPILVTW